MTRTILNYLKNEQNLPMLDLGAEIVSPSKSRMKKDRNFPAIMFKD
jgi:hypothetical protein